MIVLARPAEADDLPGVLALRSAAEAEMAPERGGRLLVEREVPALPDAVGEPDVGIWAGTIDGALLGYAVARREGGRDGRLLVRIDDLYVEPGARAVGLGEVLMDAVVGWARATGAEGIDAVALPGARDTKNFFERSGFTARKLVMHKPLR